MSKTSGFYADTMYPFLIGKWVHMLNLCNDQQIHMGSPTFNLREWLSRIERSFRHRPMVYVLMMGLIGGYVGFYASRRISIVSAIVGTLICSTQFCRDGLDFRQKMTCLVGMTFFCALIVGFQLWNHRVSRLPTNEMYDGTAVVCSANSHNVGYKNVILQLENDEKVVLLTDEQFLYGTKLKIQCQLSMISASGNPGDVNLQDYYRKQGIVRSIDSLRIHKTSTSTHNPIYLLFRLGATISETIHDYWLELTDIQTSAFLSAMIAGNDSYLSRSDKQNFSRSNMIHILVVSGAHVSYFSTTILTLLSFCTNNRKKKWYAVMILLICFGFVCGWSGSVTRSIVMYLLITAISMFGKTVDRLSSCAFSALGLIVLDPFSMFSSGVLLSFGATLSISVFLQRVESGMKKHFSFLPDEVICTISCFICAQVGMMPILISMGSSYSLLRIAAVLLAGFPAEIICSLGLIISLVSILIPITCMKRLLFVPLRGLISLLVQIAEIGASRTSDNFSFARMPMTLIIALLGVFLICVCSSGLRRWITVFASTLAAVIYAIPMSGKYKNECQVYFLDVGQGDSTLIQYCNTNILIDGGNLGNGDVIRSVMDYLDIDQIDMALMSHLDIDHVGGILELYESGDISDVYAPFWGESEDMYELESIYPQLPDSVKILRGGDVVSIDQDLSFECIWPVLPSSGGNADSLVVLLHAFDTSVLFTGDIDENVENLLPSSKLQTAQILKVAHHGSRFSTSENFLQGKFFRAAVISVGYNHYGHPTEEVLHRLEDADIEYFRTDENGCVLLTIDDCGWTMDYYFDC